MDSNEKNNYDDYSYINHLNENDIELLSYKAYRTIEQSGDSALLELAQAVGNLGRIESDGPSTTFNWITTEGIYKISEILSKTNVSLGNAWDDCADLCLKIDEKVLSIINNLVKAINQYADASYQMEQEATAAAQQYNESANSYLSELDSIEI